jgi:hypothetical protein
MYQLAKTIGAIHTSGNPSNDYGFERRCDGPRGAETERARVMGDARG